MKRKRYQPPQIDLLECRVEQGFGYSSSYYYEEYPDGLEGFSYGNSYGSSSGNGSGRTEGFTNGNSYGGARFT